MFNWLYNWWFADEFKLDEERDQEQMQLGYKAAKIKQGKKK